MARLLTALAGAAAITVLLLLTMNEVTSKFRERDGMRYFLVDFIQAPDRGRQRPTLPRAPELPPERTQPEYERATTTLPLDAPSVDAAPLTPLPAAAPALDHPAEER